MMSVTTSFHSYFISQLIDNMPNIAFNNSMSHPLHPENFSIFHNPNPDNSLMFCCQENNKNSLAYVISEKLEFLKVLTAQKIFEKNSDLDNFFNHKFIAFSSDSSLLEKTLLTVLKKE